MENDWKDRLGVVFSTDPDYDYKKDEDKKPETLPPEEQKLKILLDRKKRKGKQVTLITGFVGTNDDLKALAKELKTKCGTGGSAKDNEIIIQGDLRDKVLEHLKSNGYKAKRI